MLLEAFSGLLGPLGGVGGLDEPVGGGVLPPAPANRWRPAVGPNTRPLLRHVPLQIGVWCLEGVDGVDSCTVGLQQTEAKTKRLGGRGGLGCCAGGGCAWRGMPGCMLVCPGVPLAR